MRISDWSSDVCSSDLIMRVALGQAKDGRIHILGEMAKAISQNRTGVKENAPRITTITVPKDKIREVIGSGGKVIREIVEKTGTKIDIEDDGTIKIARSEEHTSELQSLMRISYAVFCLKKKTKKTTTHNTPDAKTKQPTRE